MTVYRVPFAERAEVEGETRRKILKGWRGSSRIDRGAVVVAPFADVDGAFKARSHQKKQ